MTALARPWPPPEPPAQLIRLRRDGQPPLRFAGLLIARHDGRLASATLWHELGLYRALGGGYAVEIVAVLAGRPAQCHAALCETLDAAVARLERHDPSADICPGVAMPLLLPDAKAVPPVALALAAASLQALRDDVTRRYRIGVGAFLAELGRQDV